MNAEFSYGHKPFGWLPLDAEATSLEAYSKIQQQ